MIPSLTLSSKYKDRFSDVEVIGKGSVADIFRANDNELGHLVALKKLTLTDKKYVDAFEREAQSLRKLNHKNIPAFYGFFEGCISMELIHGRGITYTPASDELTRSINCIMQVCDALDTVHNNGLVHRDIKPSNILVERDDIVKLIDFGIAYSIDDPSTNMGRDEGVYNYMDPEVLEGSAPTPSSDIYSLGVLLYFLATKELPFMGIHHNIVPVPTKKMQELNPDLDALIRSMLEKKAANRPSSSLEVKNELASLQS